MEGLVMSAAEVMEQLKQLSNPERLEVIEAATRLVRDNLSAGDREDREQQDRRMREAALKLKSFYEPGGELTEWTVLDGEEFLDDYV